MSDKYWVYFFLNKKTSPWQIKIGHSENIEKRRRSLERAGGISLDIFWSTSFSNREEAKTLEKLFHLYFSDDRIDGEWFHFGKNIWFTHACFSCCRSSDDFFETIQRLNNFNPSKFSDSYEAPGASA